MILWYYGISSNKLDYKNQNFMIHLIILCFVLKFIHLSLITVLINFNV